MFALAQRQRITSPLIYVPLALAVWYAVHEAGIHATIAGVALGLLMRVKKDPGEADAPVDRATARFHPISAGIAVPLLTTAVGGVIDGEGWDHVATLADVVRRPELRHAASAVSWMVSGHAI